MREAHLSPSPRCRSFVAEPDSWWTLDATFAVPVYPPWMFHAAGCAEPGKEFVWGAACALHDTRRVRSCRAAGELRIPRIHVVVQKREQRGGHLPQGSLGGQLVIRTRLGGVERCRRRGKMWPGSTVASLLAAAAGADGLECPSH